METSNDPFQETIPLCFFFHPLREPKPKGWTISIGSLFHLLEEHIDKEIFMKVAEKCEELVDLGVMKVEDEEYQFV